MEKFWELFERSVIIQSIITLLLVGLIVYQAIIGVETPEIIETMAYLVVGFWFGSKVENASTRRVVKKFTNGG